MPRPLTFLQAYGDYVGGSGDKFAFETVTSVTTVSSVIVDYEKLGHK